MMTTKKMSAAYRTVRQTTAERSPGGRSGGGAWMTPSPGSGGVMTPVLMTASPPG